MPSAKRQHNHPPCLPQVIEEIAWLNPGQPLSRQVDLSRRAAMRVAAAEDAAERNVCRRIVQQTLPRIDEIRTRLQKVGWESETVELIVPENPPCHVLVVGRHKDLRFLQRRLTIGFSAPTTAMPCK